MKELEVSMRIRMIVMAGLMLAGTAHADGVSMKEQKPGLLNRAKVNVDTATAAAQAKVPKGKIVSAEIEEENGKLIYSFDIKTKGKSGIDEVGVDAVTGAILTVQHESPRAEAKEKADDAKKASATHLSK